MAVNVLTYHDTLVFYDDEMTVPCPVPKALEQPIVGCVQLLMYNLQSHPPCLQVNSSICSLRIQHAMVTSHPQ